MRQFGSRRQSELQSVGDPPGFLDWLDCEQVKPRRQDRDLQEQFDMAKYLAEEGIQEYYFPKLDHFCEGLAGAFLLSAQTRVEGALAVLTVLVQGDEHFESYVRRTTDTSYDWDAIQKAGAVTILRVYCVERKGSK